MHSTTRQPTTNDLKPNSSPKNQDAARVATADVDDETACQLVSDLVDAGIVIPVSEERVLVHEPSNKAFESITQLTVFYQGWTAARDAGGETA